MTLVGTMPVELREQELHNDAMIGPPPRRWHVHCNKTANKNQSEHVTTWALSDEDFPVEDNGGIRGRVGRSRQFMELLQPGDRVALIARAMVSASDVPRVLLSVEPLPQFPQWVNYVREATVEVVYSV